MYAPAHLGVAGLYIAARELEVAIASLDDPLLDRRATEDARRRLGQAATAVIFPAGLTSTLSQLAAA